MLCQGRLLIHFSAISVNLCIQPKVIIMSLTAKQNGAFHRYSDDEDSTSKGKNRAKDTSWQRKAASLGLTYRPVSDMNLFRGFCAFAHPTEGITSMLTMRWP